MCLRRVRLVGKCESNERLDRRPISASPFILMMICMRCHLILSDDHSVCTQCGTMLSALSGSYPSTNKRDETGRAIPRRNDKCFDWEGHSFLIRALLLPKYLWLATVNELWVDGELVSRSGGPTFSNVAKHRLKHRGKDVEIVLKTRTRKAITGGLDYECHVDGTIVSEGILRSQYVWKQGT